MNSLQLTARLKIHDGKLEEVKELAKECLELVKDKEPDAIQYDWFISEDQTECAVRETYADSDALLAHMGNLGEALPRFLSLGEFSVEIYGNPSEELLNAINGINRKIYSFYQGLVPSEVVI